MSGYIGTQPIPQATQTRDIFTATAGQTSFATGGYTPSFLDVYLNGVHLQSGTDYTAANGSDVVLATGAAADDVLEVVAYTTFELVSPNFIGTVKSTVSTTGDFNFQADSTGGGSFKIYPDDATTANPTWVYKSNSSEAHAWDIGGAERMRLDAAGTLMLNKTSSSIGTVGVELRGAQGILTATSDNASTVYFTRKGTAGGPIVNFYHDTTHSGVIGVGSDDDLFIGEDGVGLQFQNTGADRIDPFHADNNSVRDNAIDLGGSSSRFDDIYATNGSIQTSDRNEKQDIEALSDAEQRVAVACKGLLRKFRWIDAVAEKGDGARIHFGIIAQDLQDAFAAEGLDAGRYAMFISSTWWETQTEVPAVAAVPEVLDDDGNVVTEAVKAKDAYTRTDTYETLEEAPEGATERTRLGVRYPELLAFIIGAM